MVVEELAYSYLLSLTYLLLELQRKGSNLLSPHRFTLVCSCILVNGSILFPRSLLFSVKLVYNAISPIVPREPSKMQRSLYHASIVMVSKILDYGWFNTQPLYRHAWLDCSLVVAPGLLILVHQKSKLSHTFSPISRTWKVLEEEDKKILNPQFIQIINERINLFHNLAESLRYLTYIAYSILNASDESKLMVNRDWSKFKS